MKGYSQTTVAFWSKVANVGSDWHKPYVTQLVSMQISVHINVSDCDKEAVKEDVPRRNVLSTHTVKETTETQISTKSLEQIYPFEALEKRLKPVKIDYVIVKLVVD
ncbi:Hypothetical_protein [Hexamita inflata]|uniref:Hypothetical_protein n=1 Tax=Hexamita inflata TaxID=28002 RepID=A0AA86P1A8_9EUKA|nr:Hypothetical protein HINF_LOCUS16897 [Hexamita inflata]CAI9929258.1 Hypothetical protein HINF_LOCUS16903 [Hexamita inflata]CAI9929268.1 Hypothetical protein HINF_LOCUS16913 [Hexamita inflata]